MEYFKGFTLSNISMRHGMWQGVNRVNITHITYVRDVTDINQFNAMIGTTIMSSTSRDLPCHTLVWYMACDRVLIESTRFIRHMSEAQEWQDSLCHKSLWNREKMVTKYDVCPKGLFIYYVIISRNSQKEFCNRRSPQLVVAVGHNIFEITEPHIRGQRSPQSLVPEGHKIL